MDNEETHAILYWAQETEQRQIKPKNTAQKIKRCATLN